MQYRPILPLRSDLTEVPSEWTKELQKEKTNDLSFFSFLDKMIQLKNSMSDNSADTGNLMWHSVLAISREMELERAFRVQSRKPLPVKVFCIGVKPFIVWLNQWRLSPHLEFPFVCTCTLRASVLTVGSVAEFSSEWFSSR